MAVSSRQRGFRHEQGDGTVKRGVTLMSSAENISTSAMSSATKITVMEGKIDNRRRKDRWLKNLLDLFGRFRDLNV